MTGIISIDKNEIVDENSKLSAITENLLWELRDEEIPKDKAITVPIKELSTLGAGVSSLIPAFNTATPTTEMNVSGYYRLANVSEGDTLKVAKNGNFWGAFKTPEGKSKFVQLKAADPVSTTNTITMNLIAG